MNNDMPLTALENLCMRMLDHLNVLYSEADSKKVADSVIEIMSFDKNIADVKTHSNLWDQTDVVVVTYGNSIVENDEYPLATLQSFLLEYVKDSCSTVHILPFFPYSSDDGFSVINYSEVNQSLGDWKHIEKIAKSYDVMADLVINHCSSRSLWFDNYKQGKDPGAKYFIEADPESDLSQVVRPRTSDLLRETETLDGTKYVWCTFSHDQIDLDFKNPDVLLEFIKIIKLYIDHGISVFRLDAVAFLWKEEGTSCISLMQTHEIIRLLRLVMEHYKSDVVLITETNVPNRENLSYFGNFNEAHMVYNFTLPPLILYSMLSGESRLIRQWMMSMPPAQNGTSYFNFIASHDGIGLRPVEGILTEEEVQSMVSTIQGFGGDVSLRSGADGKYFPYELNISLVDAMKGTFEGEDAYQLQRIICAHAIMLALEGVPAFYIHSLLGTENDYEKVTLSSNKRSINRHIWQYPELKQKLNDKLSFNRRLFDSLSELIELRKSQTAFHPNATQFTLHFEEALLGFWRQSMDRSQSIFCIYNISNCQRSLFLKDINLIELDSWWDLISGTDYQDPRAEIALEPYQFLWITNRRR